MKTKLGPSYAAKDGDSTLRPARYQQFPPDQRASRQAQMPPATLRHRRVIILLHQPPDHAEQYDRRAEREPWEARDRWRERDRWSERDHRGERDQWSKRDRWGRDHWGGAFFGGDNWRDDPYR